MVTSGQQGRKRCKHDFRPSAFGDPTVGDAILDRLVHSAFTIDLDGDSMRKKRSKQS